MVNFGFSKVTTTVEYLKDVDGFRVMMAICGLGGMETLKMTISECDMGQLNAAIQAAFEDRHSHLDNEAYWESVKEVDKEMDERAKAAYKEGMTAKEYLNSLYGKNPEAFKGGRTDLDK